MQPCMVFDVESVGLHGEGWAVGYVVLDSNGEEQAADVLWTDPANAEGTIAGRAWIARNCELPYKAGVQVPNLQVLRATFWDIWKTWRKLYPNLILIADCAWPVEARFLAACVDDALLAREWEGPYPLHDVATARLMAGLDPLATVDRLPAELPQHNPLADARQSARLWREVINKWPF